jgi:predicted ATP-dependent endonuclease of OLD family
MTVFFRVDKVIITNFRGIKDLEVDIPPDIPSILVGSNNACKSTVLNAIALGLRGGGFHQWSPDEFDFFHFGPGQPAAEFSISQMSVPSQNC